MSTKKAEELAELDEAVSSGNEDAVRDEFGDLLFVIARVLARADGGSEVLWVHGDKRGLAK